MSARLQIVASAFRITRGLDPELTPGDFLEAVASVLLATGVPLPTLAATLDSTRRGLVALDDEVRAQSLASTLNTAPAPRAMGATAPARRRLVILESPFAGAGAGDVESNLRYARAALRDSLLRGEAPLASHLLYTQPGVLDDADPAERVAGIEAGLAWGAGAAATVVYEDLGISDGMRRGIERARNEGRRVEIRRLDGWRR